MNRTKDFIDPNLPIPFRISDWDNGNRRILYQCPKCRASFQFFGDLEKYCHNCGRKIEWKFSPTFLDAEEKVEYNLWPQEEALAFLCILYQRAKKRKEEAEMGKKK